MRLWIWIMTESNYAFFEAVHKKAYISSQSARALCDF
jgi:hypothetical protein